MRAVGTLFFSFAVRRGAGKPSRTTLRACGVDGEVCVPVDGAHLTQLPVSVLVPSLAECTGHRSIGGR